MRDQTPRRLLCTFGALVTLTIGGCANGDTDSSSPAPAGPTSTATALPSAIPGGTAPGTGQPTTSPVLPDGRSPVYLTGVDVGKRTVTFDLIEFLTGEAAKTAYKKAHPESTQDGPDNDYFIVNDNPRLRTLPVADRVTITVVDADPSSPTPLAFSDAPAYFAAHAPDQKIGRLAWTPFWLTVRDGRVVRMEQQFLP